MRKQQREGARDPRAREVAGVLHLCGEHADCTVVDVEREFARLGEIGLRREQRKRSQAVVVVACRFSGRDRQRRTARAMAIACTLRSETIAPMVSNAASTPSRK